MEMRRERRSYTEEFKKQMVQLRLSGKPRIEIIREYDLSPTAFDRWVMQSERSGSFKEKDKQTAKVNEGIRLLKENTKLKMKNDTIK